MGQCSTSHAPWFIVPANKKWFRNLAVADALVGALKPYEKQWRKRLDEMGQREKALIEEFRASKAT